eukprot:322004-Alexandrium_andersonii.AAC.1
MVGKASKVNAVPARQLQPPAILVSAKADGAAVAVRPTTMPVAHMLTLGEPGGSLVRSARPGCHDVKALPAVGDLAISNVCLLYTSDAADDM